MQETDEATARRYHEATKHSPASVQASRHRMDWSNQPERFKLYTDLPPLSLPAELPEPERPAMEAVRIPYSEAETPVHPDLAELAYLLYHAAGVTKKLVRRESVLHFRAAACAGALYPIEVYVSAGPSADLEAGIYHFSPLDFALRKLREGDFRAALAAACGGERSVAAAPVCLIFTAITWRSAWKYQSRAYRYHFWDCGTILANALAASAALRLPSRVVMGFVDREINHLIGVDGEREKALCLLPLGRLTEPPPPAPDRIPALDLRVRPVSPNPRPSPQIDHVHAASALETSDAVRAWRESTFSPHTPSANAGKTFHVNAMPPEAWPGTPLGEVIRARGSSRRFQRVSLAKAEFATLIDGATQGYPGDWREPQAPFLNRLFINVHAVDDLPSGAYRYDPHEGELHLLKEGDFRGDSAYLTLGQALGGDSAFTVFYLADLAGIFGQYGARGYRLAQMEAGILGGKLYLMAYSFDRGASGLTFFDDLTTDFFGPPAEDLDAIFVTACGEPAPPLQRTGRLVRVPPGPLDAAGA